MRKLASFALPFCLAIFLVQYLLPWESVLPIAILCAVLIPLCLWVSPKGERRLRAVLALTGACLGLLWYTGYHQVVYAPAEELAGSTVRLEGTVVDWPQETDYGISVLVQVETAGPLNLSAVVYADQAYADLQPGDQISTVASCQLAGYRHGQEVTYYTAKGVFLTAQAYGDMTILRPERTPLRYWPALLTRALQNGISTVFSGEPAGLANALVTGDKDDLTDSFNAQLRRTGLSHVVVVSGMHLSILIWTVVSLLGPQRRRSALAGTILILLVMAMAGNTPSVVRAGILQLFLLFGPLVGRRRDSLTSLSLALLVLLAANPYAAANIGLQLSFGAVLGQYLFGSIIQTALLNRLLLQPGKAPLRRLWNGAARLIAATLAATLGSQVFTLPLCAWYFGTISLVAPLANLLILWAVTPAFLGTLAAGLLGCFLPTVGGWAALIVTPFLQWILAVTGLLSQLPFAAVTTGSIYYQAWLLLVYILLCLALLWRGKRRWLTPLCAGSVGLCAAILCTSLSFHSGALTVSVLDVGQGQSVLLRSGNYLALVDCGGDSYDNPGDIAADYLANLGRDTLDLLVLTHFHTDHANGIPQLLERVDVAVLAVPDVDLDNPLRESILTQAEEARTEVWFIEDDYTITLDDGTVFRLFAPLTIGETNEEGLTVLCSSDAFDTLITGDMNSEVEQLLLSHAQLPDIELLVVGHHGSKYSTSEELLEAVRPEMAVISVSGDNHYGHPTPEVLQRLAGAGAQVYRTDRDGTVTIYASAPEQSEGEIIYGTEKSGG